MEPLPQGRTVWHITVGTYGARLHGSDEPTVDRQHNQRGEPFVGRDNKRRYDAEARMRGEAVYLTAAQRAAIEAAIPGICERGGWSFRACAAPREPDNDHFHVLIDADPSAEPKVIRELVKRWLTQALDELFARPAGGAWWAKGGSTKPVKDEPYLRNVTTYVLRQRSTK